VDTQISETFFSKSAPKGNFGDFIENNLKIFFGYFSGFFGAPKWVLQHP